MAVLAAFGFAVPAETAAFSLLPDPRQGSVAADLTWAARWSPEPDPFGLGTGFHDGIQVAVADDFAARLEITDPAEIALLRETIVRAFAAWQTPELWFDVDFDRVPVQGIDRGDGEAGWEFDLFAVDETHPVFADESYFGYTRLRHRSARNRLLTNGQRTEGRVIIAVDIFVNVDLLLPLSRVLPLPQQAAALQRLLMHEIGHGLGFGHPNTFNTFNLHYDTDENALNPMVLDPVDPVAALLYTETRNPQAILSNDRSRIGPHLFFTELTNDDRGGRDALYPSLALCPGDCSGNGETDVTELVTMIAIALGEGEWSTCHRGDLNGDGGVQVDEILRALGRALEGGCEPAR
jgi:hypothetical protein